MAIYFQIKRKLILSWPFLVHAILQDEKKDLRMKFHFLYFQKWHCLKKGFWKYQNSISCRIYDKEYWKNCNKCFKMNLYFTNWQFYATLWSPKVNQDHCMCIVYVMFKMLENKLFVENFYLLKIIIKKNP